MKNKYYTIIFLTLLLGIQCISYSQGKFSGLVFGDYFYKVQGDSSANLGEYSPYSRDFQAFDIRRMMLIYEHTISEKFSAGFSLEGSGKFLQNGRFSVIVKTAFLEWKNIFPA